MKNGKRILLCLFIVSAFVQSCKKDLEIKDTEDYENFMEDEMEDQNIPALAALIFDENEVLFESYAGKSNLEANADLVSNDLFLIASISKVITATALLQLQDDGLFELNDPVNDYLPFEVSNPYYTEQITFKMLLTHTSSITDGDALDDQYYYGEDSPVSLSDFLSGYLVPGGTYYNESQNYADFAPGSVHDYSNTGNTLIGLLVEEISGTDFNTYCKENIFEPMGMTNTSWRLDEITQTIVQPYNYVSGEFEPITHYTFTDYPNGGLRTTPRDLYQFVKIFVNGGMSGGQQVLSAGLVNQMQTPQIPTLDEEAGLHLFVMDAENNLWGHDGGEQGVATIMGFNPSTKVGVIILANEGEANLDELFVEGYKLGVSL